MRVLIFFFSLLTCSVFFACKNPTQKANEATEYEVLANHSFTLKITGREQDTLVTARLIVINNDATQIAGKLLEPDMRVYIDDLEFRVDSARLSGVFYELFVPEALFIGTHRLIFKQGDDIILQQGFQYQPLHFSEKIPISIPRIGIDLPFTANRDVPVRIYLSDTSINGNEINRLDTLQGGRLHLRKEDLSMLASGPLYAQFTSEEEIPIKNNEFDGVIEISYTLSKDLILL